MNLPSDPSRPIETIYVEVRPRAGIPRATFQLSVDIDLTCLDRTHWEDHLSAIKLATADLYEVISGSIVTVLFDYEIVAREQIP